MEYEREITLTNGCKITRKFVEYPIIHDRSMDGKYIKIPSYYTDKPKTGNYDYSKYFQKVIKDYKGYSEEADKYIDKVMEYFPESRKVTIDEIKSTRKKVKFPKRLTNSILCKVNGEPSLKETDIDDYHALQCYNQFLCESHETSGKLLRYRPYILFHILAHMGKNHDPNYFPLMANPSHERAEEAIKTIFEKLNWPFTPIPLID